MRLWHYRLIDVLPRQQLLGQWRELNSIFKKQDKHILINYIYDYSKYELKCYSREIISEMQARGYYVNIKNYLDYFLSLGVDFHNDYTPRFAEHDNEYLTICYYNLKEKYLRGGVTEQEWQKIENRYKNIMNEI